MRSYCLAILLIALSFWVPLAEASADTATPGRGAADATPVRIADDVAPGIAPAPALAPDGGPSVAWGRNDASDGTAELMLARAPEWDAEPVVRLNTQDAVLSYTVGEAVYLGWSQEAPSRQIVSWRGGGEQAASELRPEPFPEGAVYAFDSQGRLHVAWPAEGRVEIAARADGDAESFHFDAAAREIALALDARDALHLAWVVPGASGGGALYYAPAINETLSAQVAAVAQSPLLAVGPTGVAHMLWLTYGDLYYANSLDWAEQQLVARDLMPGAYDLALGPAEQAWVTWVDDDALWYANGSCWSCSRGSLSGGGAAATPRILVDSSARPHVFWLEAGAEVGVSLWYATLLPTSLQLEVTYPIGGEVITGDTVVRAASNLPASELLRVDFDLETYLHAPNDAALMPLGSDSDGQDGWTATLAVDDLPSGSVGRVVALGTTPRGDTIRAAGQWFMVQPSAAPWVWLSAPGSLDWGVPPLLALRDAGEEVAQLDLSLVPDSLPLGVGGAQEPPYGQYVGRYALEPPGPSPQRQWLPLDDQRLPAGSYLAQALLLDESGQRVLGSASLPMAVRGLELPLVQVTSPSPGEVVEGALHAAAQIQDPDGRVKRVAFYLERDLPLLSARHRAQAKIKHVQDAQWLGLDTDGSDGWKVQVPVGPLLDGDAWYVRAVAFDDYGFSVSARSSEPFGILGRERPLAYFARPSPNGTLREEDTIQLVVTEGGEYLRRAWLYLEDADGATRLLGEMSEEGGRWTYVWDTGAFVGEAYTLIAVLEDASGHQSSIRSGGFSIADRYAYHMRSPQPGETLSGPALVTLQPAPRAPQGSAVTYYYRDGEGLLHQIGRAVWQEGEWVSVWDTMTVLDGEYYLVAHVYDQEGRITSRERRVRVNNRTPTVTFEDGHATTLWQGIETVCWQAEHPLGDPLTVSLEYSPDAGTHWLAIAQALEAEGCHDWDTADYPDATEARLRLSASDGTYTGYALIGPVEFANHNQAPVLSVLAPKSDAVYGSRVDITWRAWDPDEDVVLLDLSYRAADEDWAPLARGLANSGRYQWSADGLAADTLYDLQVVARDASGASTTAIIEGLTFQQNLAPSVRLLGPQGGSRFNKDLLIVWDAQDPDDDELLIDIYYSDNAGQTWLPLAEGVANTGYYVWQVSFLPSGSHYRIRVVARDGLHQVSDESGEVFAVGAATPPRVMLLDPLPGGVLSGEQFVRWSAVDPDGAPVTVSLRIRPAGETAWEPIVEGLANDSFYVWDTAQHPNGAYELRLTVSNGRVSASASLAEPVLIENNPNREPGVILEYPRQDDVWGALREIRWQAWDPDGGPITATLAVRGVGDDVWQELAAVDARTGYYLWEPTEPEAWRAYEVSVEVTDGAASARDRTATPVYVGPHTNRPPRVWLTAPDVGALAAGGVLSWIAEDPDGDPLSIALEVTSDEGLSWQTVATDMLPIGSYDLTRLGLHPQRTYRLRLRASDGAHVSQALTAPFEWPSLATPEFELAIEAPVEGAVWSGTQRILWDAQDLAGLPLAVDLEVSGDGGRSWLALAEGVDNGGVYSWDTSEVPNGLYLLRVTVASGQARQVLQTGPFAIDNAGGNAPRITLIHPQRGEVWSGTREIRWHSWDDDGDALRVTLAYSLNMGVTWQVFARTIADSGGYILDTGTIPSSDLVWLRATVSDGKHESETYSQGPFAVVNARGPLIRLVAPGGGARWADGQSIVWQAADDAGRPLSVSLEESSDQGQSWRTVAEGLPAQGSHMWEAPDTLPRTPIWLRAVASDGVRSAVDIVWPPLQPHSVAGAPELPFFAP